MDKWFPPLKYTDAILRLCESELVDWLFMHDRDSASYMHFQWPLFV